MALFHLIYFSSARAEIGAAELHRILESSARQNTLHGVTGMLLFLNGSFMQVLEGEEAVVDESYARIRQDPRHTGLILIDRSPITARSFDRWSMGFKHLRATEAVVHPAYALYFRDGFDAAAIGAKQGVAFDILKSFARGQGS